MALQGIEVEGVIIKEYPAKEGVSSKTGNAWKSQEFVIQTKDQYPRACLFRVFGAEKLEQFNLHQGDTVHVWLDNSINTGAQMSTANSQFDAATPAPANNAQPAADPLSSGNDAADDLPF